MKILLFIMAVIGPSHGESQDHNFTTVEECYEFIMADEFVMLPGYIYVCGAGAALSPPAAPVKLGEPV